MTATPITFGLELSGDTVSPGLARVTEQVDKLGDHSHRGLQQLGDGADRAAEGLHGLQRESKSLGDTIGLVLGKVGALRQLGDGADQAAHHVRGLAGESQGLGEVLGLALGKVGGLGGMIAGAGLDLAKTGIRDLVAETTKLARVDLNGVGERMKRALAGPALAETTSRLEQFIRDLERPESRAALEDLGTKFGKVTHAAFELFDQVAAGAREVVGWLKPITDVLGQWIDQLPASGDAWRSAWQDVDAEAARATERAQMMTRETERTSAEVQGLQEHLQRVRDGETAIRAAAEASLAPYREKLTILERQYALQHQETELSRLNAAIKRDSILGRDSYSSEGIAAQQRLREEITRRDDLQGEMAHTKQKNRLEDQVTGIEKERDRRLNAAQATEQAIERQITTTQRQLEQKRQMWAAEDAAHQQQRVADQKAQADADALYKRLQILDYGYDQNTHSITEVLKQLGLLGVFDLSQLQGQVDDLLKRFGINKGGLAGLISDSRREFADLVSYVQTHAKVAGDALDAIMRSGEAAAVRIQQAFKQTTPAQDEWLSNYDQQVQSTFGTDGGWTTADDAYEKQHRAHLREQAQERGEAGPDEITDPARRKWLEQRETHANESAAQQRAWLEQQETHANQPMTRTSEDYDENGRPQRQRAMGGPVERGVPYWVGERGPERFIPTQDGTILPTTAPDGGTPSLGAGGYSSLGGNSSGGGGGPLRVELTLHIPELARDLVTEIVLSPGVLRRVHRDLADAMR